MSTHEGPVVEFHLTPEEWVESVHTHQLSDPLLKKNIRTGQFLLVAIWVVVSLLWIMDGSMWGPALTVIPLALAVPLLPALARSAHRKNLGKLAENGIANGTFGPHRITLTEEGMLNETTGYTLLTRWSAIDRVEHTDDLFMIYLGPQAFVPVPTSAFRDSAALREFSERFYEGVAAAPEPSPDVLPSPQRRPGPDRTPREPEPVDPG